MCNAVRNYQEQVHQLEAVQFSPRQAEALILVIEERQMQTLANLATRQDITDVRREITDVNKSLKQEIADVKKDLTHEIIMLEKKLNHRMTLGFFILGVLCFVGPNAKGILEYLLRL